MALFEASGLVVDQDRRPLADVDVTIWTPEEPYRTKVDCLKTDAEGRWRIPSFRAPRKGAIKALARRSGFTPLRLALGVEDIQAGPTIILNQAASVSVEAIDERGARYKPHWIFEASVQAYDAPNFLPNESFNPPSAYLIFRLADPDADRWQFWKWNGERDSGGLPLITDLPRMKPLQIEAVNPVPARSGASPTWEDSWRVRSYIGTPIWYSNGREVGRGDFTIPERGGEPWLVRIPIKYPTIDGYEFWTWLRVIDVPSGDVILDGAVVEGVAALPSSAGMPEGILLANTREAWRLEREAAERAGVPWIPSRPKLYREDLAKLGLIRVQRRRAVMGSHLIVAGITKGKMETDATGQTVITWGEEDGSTPDEPIIVRVRRKP